MLAVQPRFLRLSSMSLSTSESRTEKPVSESTGKSSQSPVDEEDPLNNNPGEAESKELGETSNASLEYGIGDDGKASKPSSQTPLTTSIKSPCANADASIQDGTAVYTDSYKVTRGAECRRELTGNSELLANAASRNPPIGHSSSCSTRQSEVETKLQRTTSVEEIDEEGTRFKDIETSQTNSTSVGLTQEGPEFSNPVTPGRRAESHSNAPKDGEMNISHSNVEANSSTAEGEKVLMRKSQPKESTEASTGSTENATAKLSINSEKNSSTAPSTQAISTDISKAGERLPNGKSDHDTMPIKEIPQDCSKDGHKINFQPDNAVDFKASDGVLKMKSMDPQVSADKDITTLMKVEEVDEKEVSLLTLPPSKKQVLESPVTPLKSVNGDEDEGVARENEILSKDGIVERKPDGPSASRSISSKGEDSNMESKGKTRRNLVSTEDPSVHTDGSPSSKARLALPQLAVVTSMKRTADEEKMMTPRAKRVRFTEPPSILKSASPRIGFSGITKLRRRRERQRHSFTVDIDDLSVVSMGASGPDRKAQQVLLDELQYLLDGIFKKQSSNTHKQRATDTAVLVSSLKTLVKLLLRKPKKRRLEQPESECGTLVQILVGQPALLRNIVRRLCSVLGKSRTSDSLVALVLVVIFRSTPKLCLVGETELEVLLNSFFRNAGGGLKEGDGEQGGRSKVSNDKEGDGRRKRRGALARRLESSKKEVGAMESLNNLLSTAQILDEHGSGFKTEMNVTTYLMSIAISYVLRYHEDAQMWMRNNRKLDKIVAVLYSCEKVMLSKHKQQSESNASELCLSGHEGSAAWIGLGCSMRILEFAALDSVCQRRLAHESRVGHLATVILRSKVEDNDGFLGTEWMVCSALRLCINLCHGCDEGSRKFVEANGHVLVLNCLMEECKQAGLLDARMEEEEEEVEKGKGSESFDIRVLCLAMLASIVNQDGMICSQFGGFVPKSEQFEHGTLSVVLSILKSAEGGANVADGEGQEREVKCLDGENEGWSVVIERKITVGYVCLLIGALAMGSEESRKTLEAVLPGNSMVGVASVLAEFLEFHHEVGVISGSMDRMYANIIQKLVEPEMERHQISISQGLTEEEMVPDATTEAMKDVDDESDGQKALKEAKNCKEKEMDVE